MPQPLKNIFSFDMNGKTVSSNALIPEAVACMEQAKKHCLLVLDKGKPVGILSEHDVVIAFARLGQDAKMAKVRDYMTIDIVAARDTDTITDALKMMAVHSVRHLPVLSENGKIVDFLSITDLLATRVKL